MIYLVEGNTGEYEDHRDWLVKAFFSEVKAQKLVIDAQTRANEIFQNRKSISNESDGINEFDPNFMLDYTGTYYKYYSIEVDEEL